MSLVERIRLVGFIQDANGQEKYSSLQIVTICTALTVLVARGAIQDFGLLSKAHLSEIDYWSSNGVYWLTIITVAITVYSGFVYLQANRKLLSVNPARTN